MKRLFQAFALFVGVSLAACAHAQTYYGTALVAPPTTTGNCPTWTTSDTGVNALTDSGVGCLNSQVNIHDGVHGSMLLVPSVFGSPSSAGILNTTSAQPVIVGKGVATTGADAYDFYSTRIANYAGGTPGFVNSNWRFLDTVSAGTKSFEWTLTSIVDNSAAAADATENVAIYAQAHKRNDGGTWASVSELLDYNANPSSPSVTHEYDLEVTGTDNTGSGARVILDGWAKSRTGAAAVARHGFRINTDANTTLTNAFETNGTYTHGINLTGGSFSVGALELGSGQKFCFDGTGCTEYLSQSGGTLTYTTPTGGIFSLGSTGTLTNFGNVAVGGNVQISAGNKLCLDGATCANFINETGNVTSISSSGGVLTNSLLATQLATSGNVLIPTGQKLCLDGGTCANYLTQSGGSIGVTATGVNLPSTTATNLGIPSGNKLCLDGVTCTNYLTQSGGTVSIFAGTQTSVGALTALSLNTAGGAISGGAITSASETSSGTVQGATLTSTGNVIVSTNQKLCLNGSSCTVYILFDGTLIQFVAGGSAKFVMNTSTGTAGSASGYTVGVSSGVTCSTAGTRTTIGGLVVGC